MDQAKDNLAKDSFPTLGAAPRRLIMDMVIESSNSKILADDGDTVILHVKEEGQNFGKVNTLLAICPTRPQLSEIYEDKALAMLAYTPDAKEDLNYADMAASKAPSVYGLHNIQALVEPDGRFLLGGKQRDLSSLFRDRAEGLISREGADPSVLPIGKRPSRSSAISASAARNPYCVAPAGFQPASHWSRGRIYGSSPFPR